MKKIVFVFFILASVSVNAQTVNFEWAKAMGGTYSASGTSVDFDDAGNVYTTGFFSGTVDFDPGPGTYDLTSANGQDIFVSKLDATGNFVWAKRMGGLFDDLSLGIVTEGSGNVYITGSFSNTVDFDPGPGTYNLSGPGSFVCKLDAAGNFVWATKTSDGISESIAIDAVGNVYSTGYVDTLFINDNDIYISKLNNAGAVVWTKFMGGLGNNDGGTGIALDEFGDIYLTGTFNGTSDFDPGPGTYNLTANSTNNTTNFDVFIAKLNAAGNFIWARQIDGPGNDFVNGIATGPAGNVFITGAFEGTADFDPGPGSFFLNATNKDVFVAKLDVSGNFVWAKPFGGPASYDDIGRGITADGVGNVYTTDYFLGTVDFDPGPGNYELTTVGNGSNAFISKLDPAGNFAWAKQLEGNSNGQSVGVTAGNGEVIVTGSFGGTVDFDPGPGNYALTGFPPPVFVLKLSQGSVVPVTLLNFEANRFNNTVQLHWKTATEQNSDYFIIEKSNDGRQFTPFGKITAAGYSNVPVNYSFTDNAPGSINYYRLKQVDKAGKKEYSRVLKIVTLSRGKEMAVYPNPAKNFINIINPGGKNETADIGIYNAQGRLVTHLKQTNEPALYIDVKHLPPGLYNVRITAGETVRSANFIKQ